MKATLIALLVVALARPVVAGDPIPVILDSDANNELDDQHAIAYLLLNPDTFDTLAITVNRTQHGGGIDQHVAEAERVTTLSGQAGRIPVIAGADGDFETIRKDLDNPRHDGYLAVDFIIKEALRERPQPLLLLPVGKLTNIALALEKAPSIASRVRIVWLGSNYPDPGEYNQDNDEASLNYLLNSETHFEIVTVRYNADSGSTRVRITPGESAQRVAGTGPWIEPAVEGRNGGSFNRVGDYLASLVAGADLYGDPPARSLFDMAAVAIVKHSGWASTRLVPAPILVNGHWQERTYNPRQVTLWENFDRDAIINDFVASLEQSSGNRD